MNDRTDTAAQHAASAASAAYKLGGVGAAAAGAWTLQEWSHLAAIASAVVAAVAGVIYSAKMLIEIYWTVRLKRAELAHMEKDSK